MKTYVVYKENSDHARAVAEFIHDFNKQTGKEVEPLNPETLQGESFCKAYGIVEYPTVISTADDYQMLKMWAGMPLPTIMEVSYYV